MPSVLCTPVQYVTVDGITVVGERINPTGKKRFQQAIREGDVDYILAQAISQAESGAAVLDVNVGVPGVDEPAVMERVVKALQSVVSLPLQLDSSNAAALERGLRVYNGKPIVNSVNGEQAVLDQLLPLCKKYGAAVVGLTLDERGIPKTAAQRAAIAARIRDAALAAGIPREDIYIDCLTLTASAQQEDVMATLEAPARLQGGTGGAHGAGRVQHQLWAALPALPERRLFDHGHVRGARPCHHEPGQRGDDGGGLCLWRPVGAGQAERAVHRPVRRAADAVPGGPSPPRRRQPPRPGRALPPGPTPP